MKAINNGFTRQPLEDLVELADSGTWGDDGIPGTDSPVLRSTNIADNRLDLSEPAWRVISTNDQVRRRLVTGDIIVTKSSGSPDHIGKCAIFNHPGDGKEYYFSNFMLRLRAKKGHADPRWLHYWLTSGCGRFILQQMNSTTTGLRNLSVGQYLQQRLPTPSLVEQRRIADILDKANAIRRKRQEALHQLVKFIDSQFLEMFGDPVTNPKGWNVLPFAEVAHNRDSLRVPLKESDRDLRHGEFPYYGSVGVIDHIDDYIFEGEHLLISEDGKHLESRNRPIACLASGKFWVNNHAHVLAENGRADLCFLAWQIEHRPIREHVTGIDQFKLNRSSLDRIPVCLPPMEIQRQFRRLHTHTLTMKVRCDDALSSANDLCNSFVQRAFRGDL